MAELDFSDLIPKAAPTAAPGASAGLSFDDLIPQAAVAQPTMANAVTDIPKEIGSEFTTGVQHLTGNSVSDLPGYDPRTRGQLGPIEGLMRTGRQILAPMEMLAAIPMGAARSVIGNTMAQGEHAVGKLIAPETAANDDLAKMVDAGKADADTAMSAARPRVAKAPAIAAPSINELKEAASAAYKSPEVLGLEIKPEAIKNYSDRAKVSLNAEGFDDIVAPKTFAVLERVQNFPAGTTVTGQNLNSLRKTLGKVAGSTEATERAAATFAIDHLDEFIPKLTSKDVVRGDPAAAAATLAEARGNYSAAKQSEKIDQKVVRAEIRAGAANSGMNVENTVRQRLADVAINPKEARGLTASEVEQARKISEGTPLQNTIRFAGNLLGGGGGLGAVVTGLPTAGIAPAVGFGLKILSNSMTLNKANRLSEAIRMRAPLASSVEKFGEAFAKHQEAKTPQSYAGVILAARNLAHNLPGGDYQTSLKEVTRSIERPQ